MKREKHSTPESSTRTVKIPARLARVIDQAASKAGVSSEEMFDRLLVAQLHAIEAEGIIGRRRL